MSWVKIDDKFHAHRKTKRAWKWRAALGLHLMALSYCADHLTDGHVDVEFVEEKLPSRREMTATAEALVTAGLWTSVEGGWEIHDYLKYNPSRADVLAKRAAEVERKAKARDVKSARNPQSVRAEVERNPRGNARVSALPVPDPLTTTTPLTPQGGNVGDTFPERPKNGRQRSSKEFEADVEAFAAHHFPGADAGLVKYAESLCRRGGPVSVDQLRPIVEQFRPREEAV